MENEIHIKEINPINVENGVIINGCPSSGITSAIATESMINTSNFELGGIIDSDRFPPISIIKMESQIILLEYLSIMILKLQFFHRI